ncbi:hypothetical protein CYMTET_35432 [Cymbomonas tetramitiformis]|uniref:SET domain-containing protein n=1 Tax=Cymbomonas tetramitiformis TaxID=36881 RepID=A0AAE0F957_9CHLO|nr:hypothetical protein CYMTET_35432 [Cymbomonas tetramitiformis]
MPHFNTVGKAVLRNCRGAWRASIERGIASNQDYQDSEQPELRRFVSWLTNNQVAHGNVRLQNQASPNAQRGIVESGWGLLAAKDCEVGEVMVHLPSELLLSYDDTSDPALLELIRQ